MGILRARCRILGDPEFYRILREISSTFTESIRSRRYLETANGREKWDAIVSLEMRRYFSAYYQKTEPLCKNKTQKKASKTRSKPQ
jgi:hypothetical protein